MNSPKRPVRFQVNKKDVETDADTDEKDLVDSDTKTKLKAAMQMTKRGKTLSLALLNAKGK